MSARGVYTDDELCALFRGCREGREQIKILSQLSGRTEEDIRAMLIAHGHDVERSKRLDFIKSVMALREKGYTYLEIAEKLGSTQASVAKAVSDAKRMASHPERAWRLPSRGRPRGSKNRKKPAT